MASPEVEIYKSVRRFSDYTKDALVTNIIEKLRAVSDVDAEGLNSVVSTIETTFEQCNFNGMREVESAVQNALKR